MTCLLVRKSSIFYFRISLCSISGGMCVASHFPDGPSFVPFLHHPREYRHRRMLQHLKMSTIKEEIVNFSKSEKPCESQCRLSLTSHSSDFEFVSNRIVRELLFFMLCFCCFCFVVQALPWLSPPPRADAQGGPDVP